MPHVYFDVNSVGFTDFFQDGGGRDTYFEGIPYQRGYGKEHRAGIGAVFRSLLRVLLPVMKKAGPVLKKEGLETGARILNDIADGVPVKEAVVEEVKTGAKNIAKRTLQEGGRRRKRRTRKRKLWDGRFRKILREKNAASILSDFIEIYEKWHEANLVEDRVAALATS